MIQRNDNLLGIESQLAADGFHGIDGGAVHAGLAGFSQAAVADMNAETFEQAFQRRRTAVEVGSLHYFRREVASHQWPAAMRPAVLRMSAMGEMRSMATSTLPGRPCCRGMGDREPATRTNSARTWPSRISPATLSTWAAMVPYCAQG